MKVQTYFQIFLFNASFGSYLTLLFIYLFYKTLSKHGVHPKRYFWLIFHIFFSNYASYFLFHLILSYKFLHLKKVLSLLNENCWKRFLKRYFHYFQLFMILLFCNFFLFFKLILCSLVLRYTTLTHNQVEIWMSMNLNMRWKPPLHWYILSNVSFVIFHIVPF